MTDSDRNRLGHVLVRVTQEETGLARETESGDNGMYELGSLPLGFYSVEVSKPGFAAAKVERVHLCVGQTKSLDATLSRVCNSTSVDVTASGSDLDPVSAAIGTRLENRQIPDLPVNGRN